MDVLNGLAFLVAEDPLGQQVAELLSDGPYGNRIGLGAARYASTGATGLLAESLREVAGRVQAELR